MNGCLDDQRRFADARFAGDEAERARDKSAAENAVQLADPGREALILAGLDVRKGDRLRAVEVVLFAVAYPAIGYNLLLFFI